MKYALPLYGKISLWITGVAIASMFGLASLALWSSNNFHQEVTQKLHKGLAQYVLDHQPAPLISATGIVNKTGLKDIAKNTMMINPAVEVYLLDSHGYILGHALPEATVSPKQIDLRPVLHFFDQKSRGPILGENPRDPKIPGIFSAAPLLIEERTMGYLYIILTGHEMKSLAQRLADSHIFRLTLGSLVALAIFLGLSILLSFLVITKPLYRLTQQVRAYRKSRLTQVNDNSQAYQNEIAELEHSFELMQDRIQQQFDRLRETDKLRRELISNVSHDLRTPLSSMQGYLETLILKFDKLNSDKQKFYLKVAHRHSKQMANLVGQLFELAKLDAGRIAPEPEIFSLTELLFDIKQDYELIANKKQVKVEILSESTTALVNADIGLIQRVLQNLMDNALRFTPRGGNISILSKEEGNQVRVNFRDSGSGIAHEELPFVFERFYQAQSGQKVQKPLGAGLGLSIVKRILDLHGSIIEVQSIPGAGTNFSFSLPAPA